MRTLTQILIEADRSTTLKRLSELSDEIYDTRKIRPKHEVIFGLEHIRDLGSVINNELIYNKLMADD